MKQSFARKCSKVTIPVSKNKKKCAAFLKGVAILKRVGITGNILKKQGLYVVRTKMDIYLKWVLRTGIAHNISKKAVDKDPLAYIANYSYYYHIYLESHLCILSSFYN